jgi:hypothetical protein
LISSPLLRVVSYFIEALVEPRVDHVDHCGVGAGRQFG